MDSLDLRILEILQRDNRTSSERIASVVGLSSTAVQRRIKRLRELGVIIQDTSVVSPDAVGRKLTVIVEVTLSKAPSYGLDAFKQSVRETPEVTQCYLVTGKADFVLIISRKSSTLIFACVRSQLVSVIVG